MEGWGEGGCILSHCRCGIRSPASAGRVHIYRLGHAGVGGDWVGCSRVVCPQPSLPYGLTVTRPAVCTVSKLLIAPAAPLCAHARAGMASGGVGVAAQARTPGLVTAPRLARSQVPAPVLGLGEGGGMSASHTCLLHSWCWGCVCPVPRAPAAGPLESYAESAGGVMGRVANGPQGGTQNCTGNVHGTIQVAMTLQGWGLDILEVLWGVPSNSLPPCNSLRWSHSDEPKMPWPQRTDRPRGHRNLLTSAFGLGVWGDSPPRPLDGWKRVEAGPCTVPCQGSLQWGGV